MPAVPTLSASVKARRTVAERRRVYGCFAPRIGEVRLVMASVHFLIKRASLEQDAQVRTWKVITVNMKAVLVCLFL